MLLNHFEKVHSILTIFIGGHLWSGDGEGGEGEREYSYLKRIKNPRGTFKDAVHTVCYMES